MTNWDSLSSHQKLSLGVFIVIGLSTIVLGFFRINKAIVLPFKRKTDVTFKSSEQLEKERTQRLRTQDTDGDGLNDYDELYVFRTSPFLEDSDSDGENDGAEVAAESDPNCPRGKTCRQAKIFAAGQQQTQSGGVATPPSSTASTGSSTGTTDTASEAEAKVMAVIVETFGPIETLTPEKIKVGLENMTGNQLREFLGKLGVPPAALQRADDATLRQLVQETLNEIAIAPAEGTSTNAPEGSTSTNTPTN